MKKSSVCVALVLMLSLASKVSAAEEGAALVKAAEVGDIEKVRSLLAGGADPNARDRDGYTALIWAAYRDRNEIASALVQAKADVNLKEPFMGLFALGTAAGRGNAQMVEELLKAGADVHQEDNSGHSCLTSAALEGHATVVRRLVEAGSNLEVPCRVNNGETVLIGAARLGKADVVDVLLEAGAKVNAKDRDAFTALMGAAREGHVDIVKKLLDAGAELEAKDSGYGRTALMFAVEKGRVEVVKLLLEAGAATSGSDASGDKLADLARRSENPEIVRILKISN